MRQGGEKGREGRGIKEGKGEDGGPLRGKGVERGGKEGEGRDGNKGRGGRGRGPLRDKGVERGGEKEKRSKIGMFRVVGRRRMCARIKSDEV